MAMVCNTCKGSGKGLKVVDYDNKLNKITVKEGVCVNCDGKGTEPGIGIKGLDEL